MTFAAPGAYAQASAAAEIALRDLLQQAEEGVPYARYRLGQMYADGQEIERDDLLALMWLGCAARDKDADVRRAAIRKRAELEPRAGPVLAAMGWLLAELRCDSEKSGGSPYNPDREELPEKVFFFPGDVTMSASLNASESLGLTWLREQIWRTYTKLGNILVGLISILLWFLCIKGVNAIARTTDSTTGYSTWAWNRTPDEVLTSTPLPRPTETLIMLRPVSQIAPRHVDDIEQAEHFVLRGFRRWALSLRAHTPHLWSQVWNEFAKRLGPEDGRMALSGLAGCIGAIQINARRTINHHPPCCRYATPDEMSFVSFIGACQRADWTLSHDKAQWLVRSDGIGDLLQAGSRLATVLSRHGLIIPNRRQYPGFSHIPSAPAPDAGS